MCLSNGSTCAPTLRGEHGQVTGEVHFGRVMMKPGKPLTFAEVRLADAADDSGRPMLVFAVPGNPVSAAVTFQLTVLPALRRLMGWRDPRLRRLHCVLAGGDLTVGLCTLESS
jgi:molybdopterin biosynthesis enzyme